MKSVCPGPTSLIQLRKRKVVHGISHATPGLFEQSDSEEKSKANAISEIGSVTYSTCIAALYDLINA